MKPEDLRKCVLTALAASFGLMSPAGAGAPGEEWNPKADDEAMVVAGNARFTVLTDRLIRMEWSADGAFEDRASITFVNRRLPVPEFTVQRSDGGCTIQTASLRLEYKGGRFSRDTLSVGAWRYGDNGGANLLGTARTLDRADGLASILPKMCWGVVSRDGWAVVNDSKRHLFVPTDDHWGEWVVERPEGDRLDLYFFGYGHDYKGALGDYVKVAGRIGLPPRWSFGYWWSRYWLYSEREVRELVASIRNAGVPMDVMILDMEWHETWEVGMHGRWRECPRDEFGQQPGWTGYTWNKRLFPKPEATLSWLHDHNLKVAPNLHPASGIEPREDCYERFAKDYGWTGTNNIPYRLAERKWADIYFADVLGPMESQGVDFWWLDWQQWRDDKLVKGLSNTFWLNHIFFRHQGELDGGTRRPFIYHRWGGLGSHRYSVGFSGDCAISWDMLRAIPYFTATAANVGYGYWGHDIGGHMRRDSKTIGLDGDIFLRWLQGAVFTPIFKTHSTKDPFIERRIWCYPDRVDDLRAAVRLRYRLAPYIYTAARRSWETGVSVCRPLYYDWPEADEAYDREARTLMFGDDILACTLADPEDPVTKLTACDFWLPEGRWFDVETGTMLDGGRRVELKRSASENAWFVKAGSIVPMLPDSVMSLQEKAADGSVMTLAVTPGAASGAGELYEDDGVTSAYPEKFAKTAFAYSETNGVMRLLLGARKGAYDGMPATRQWTVRLPNRLLPDSVDVSVGVAKTHFDGDDMALVVELDPVPAGAPLEIVLRWSPLACADEKRLDGLRGHLNRAQRIGEEFKNLRASTGDGRNVPNEWLDFSTAGSQLAAADTPDEVHAVLDSCERAYGRLPEVYGGVSAPFPPESRQRFAAQLLPVP